MNDTVRDLLRVRPSRLKAEWVFTSATEETALDSQNFVNRVFVPASSGRGSRTSRGMPPSHVASRLVMKAPTSARCSSSWDTKR